MRHRINFAIGRFQRGHKKGPALQAFGVPKGGQADIQLGALIHERGKGRRHHHGRHVARVQVLIADIDAEALQHGDQALFGEGGVVQGISRAVQPDNNTVADELVLPDSFEIDDILDAGCFGVGRGGRRQSKQHENGSQTEETQNRFSHRFIV